MRNPIIIATLVIGVLYCLSCLADRAGNLNCGVSIKVVTTKTEIGSNITWKVILVNNSASNQTVRLNRQINALLYNGQAAGRITELTTTNTLNPLTTNILELTVSSADYEKFTGLTRTFQMNTIIDVPGTNDVWFDPIGGRIVLITPINFLSLSPTPPISVGDAISANVAYLNPFNVNLTGVKVHITADRFLTTNNIRQTHEFNLGVVYTNEYVQASMNFIASTVGTGTIWAAITASNLMDVNMSVYVPISLQKDGAILPAQVTLKPEALEVSPGILTAFVRLSAGYPVSGITSATCDGAPAERMMPNEDGTEMIIKFRRKDIEAALGQKGEVLDTQFVVRGTWQGASGTSVPFQGSASIKKIVGAKEKPEKPEKPEK